MKETLARLGAPSNTFEVVEAPTGCSSVPPRIRVAVVTGDRGFSAAGPCASPEAEWGARPRVVPAGEVPGRVGRIGRIARDEHARDHPSVASSISAPHSRANASAQATSPASDPMVIITSAPRCRGELRSSVIAAAYPMRNSTDPGTTKKKKIAASPSLFAFRLQRVEDLGARRSRPRRRPREQEPANASGASGLNPSTRVREACQRPYRAAELLRRQIRGLGRWVFHHGAKNRADL